MTLAIRSRCVEVSVGPEYRKDQLRSEVWPSPDSNWLLGILHFRGQVSSSVAPDDPDIINQRFEGYVMESVFLRYWISSQGRSDGWSFVSGVSPVFARFLPTTNEALK